MIYGTLIFFGDSLTYGSRDPDGLSFPIFFARNLSKDTGQMWNAVNLGVPGETTADMLRRSYVDVKKYPEAKDIFLLAGTNDARDNVCLETFKENYIDIIKDFKILGKRIYCCTIPLKNGFGSPGYELNVNVLINSYNKIIREVADIVVELEDLDKDCFIDGVHFSHKGNLEVARRIDKVLRENR
jgi:lysophospholipase L1-like esterase